MGQDGYLGEVDIKELFKLFDIFCLENLFLRNVNENENDSIRS